MAREAIPKGIRDKVLDEYDHRCAVCGSDRPHLHHIDEDNRNNAVENILPLCPNCHLRDQHNPTRKIEIPKLKLFRKYKNPAILKPQFHPLYLRMNYLDGVEENDHNTDSLANSANELIEFIESWEMGSFYGKRIRELIGRNNSAFVMVLALGGGSDPTYERQKRQLQSEYRKSIIENSDAALLKP